MTIIKSFKGFNKDLTCRGLQYREGEDMPELDGVIICKKGYHACENPIDCFSYYSPAESVFHEVEQSGKIAKHNNDSKVASTKIKIGLKIDFQAMIKAAIQFIYDRTDNKKEVNEKCSVASNSGYRSVASNSGDRSVASNSGNDSVALSWGIEGQVSGAVGTTLICAEWKYKNNQWEKVGAKLVVVDGKKIKADTFYTLKNGKFVKV